MVELRQPPSLSAEPARASALVSWPVLQTVLLVAILIVLSVVVLRAPQTGERSSDPERLRELSSRLKAAGALDESALLMEQYAESANLDADTHASIAYGLGQTYLERGRPERALRWFYQAEVLAQSQSEGALREEISRKIVHSLERMGRHHAAQAALESRVRLAPADGVARPESDPVVARVGDREILRSEIDRALDEIGAPAGNRSIEQRQEFLRRFVADELLYRKARKLEYDRDPEVTRALGRMAQQLVISKFVEKEVLGELVVAEPDLENYFAANRRRYTGNADSGKAGEGTAREVALDDVRQAVKRDYLQSKAQAAYQELIDRELEIAEVELFPDKLSDG